MLSHSEMTMAVIKRFSAKDYEANSSKVTDEAPFPIH
jgi:hypothetical protein